MSTLLNPYFLLLLAILANYRLSLLATKERGLFAVFERIRGFAGMKAAKANDGGIWYELAEMLECPHCLGAWLALPLALLIVGFSPLAILAWLAIAGGQSFLTVLEVRRWV